LRLIADYQPDAGPTAGASCPPRKVQIIQPERAAARGAGDKSRRDGETSVSPPPLYPFETPVSPLPLSFTHGANRAPQLHAQNEKGPLRRATLSKFGKTRVD